MIPFDYQLTGIDFLSHRRRCLLLDDPGTGKTLQAVKAADKIDGDMDVICPASVVRQWGEAHARLSGISKTFNAYSYEKARDKGISKRPAILCLDEIHYLNNPNSGRTVAILGRERYGVDGHIFKAEYVWGLTGTWMTRDPSVLYQTMFAVIPGSLVLKNGNTMSYWQFMRKFCVMYDSGNGMRVVNSQNLDELRDRLAPFILRRTKADVRKDWKNPVTAELWLDPAEAGKSLDKAELEPEARCVAEAFKKGGFNALETFADTESTGVSRYRRYCGVLKIIPVVEWLLDQFDDGMKKIVIVCVHREVIEGIQVKLAENGIPAFIYYGGMTGKEKDAARDSFIAREDRAVLIGQIAAMGTGVDGLQKATGRMLFVEWSWIATENWQALDRLDRVGQEENVLGQFAAFEGSLDGAIMTVAARRAKDSKQLFG